MKNIFIVLIILSALKVSAQDEAVAILKNSIAALKSQKAVSYNVDYIFKGSDRPDTLYFSAKGHMQRHASDEIFGGKLRLAQDNSNSFILYDLNKIYLIDRINVAGKSWDPHVNNNHSLKFNGDLIWRDFLEPDKLTVYLDKSATVEKLRDTIINGNDCYKISIELPYAHFNDTYRIILSINQKDYIPVLKEMFIPNGNTNQYTSFLLKSYEFNKVEDEALSARQIPDFYKIKTLN